MDQVAKLLSAKTEDQSSQRRNLTNQYLELELECSAKSVDVSAGEKACAKLSKTSKSLTATVARESIARATAEEFPWNKGYKGSYLELLKARRDALEGEKRQVLDAMESVSDTFMGFVEGDRETIASVIDSKKEDNWLQFEYKSEEEKKSSQSTFTKTMRKFKKRVLFFTSSYEKTTTTSTSSSTASQVELSVKAKLLRVHIKRPWFRPEVFDDKNLDFVSGNY